VRPTLQDEIGGFATVPGGVASGPAPLGTVTLAIAVLVSLAVAVGRAATADDTTARATRSDAVFDPDAWHFRVALCGWAPSVAGCLDGTTFNAVLVILVKTSILRPVLMQRYAPLMGQATPAGCDSQTASGPT